MRRLLSGLALLAVFLFPKVSFAQWVLDGVSLTAVPFDQSGATIVADGAGGAIITWMDGRSGTYDTYVQRVDAGGMALWAANGVALCTAASDQWFPSVVTDGAGGAIVAWWDNRTGTGDIYAQRVNAAGAVQWAANGVALCTAADAQEFPRVATDGAGGAVVAWTDYRSLTNYDVFAQRVNGAGAVQWAANGVLLCSDATDQDSPQIISDGAGGAAVVWRDWRYGASDQDIFAQKINGAGVLQWGPNGISMCNALGNQLDPQLVPDGAGGAVLAWHDYRSGNADIYSQHVNAAGTFQWGLAGAALCVEPQNQRWVAIASDGAGGAVVAWDDDRFFDSDVYAQRVSAAGAPTWTGNGVAFCNAPNTQFIRSIVSDGAGGFIFAWTDYRGGSTVDFANVFAQRVSAAGAVQWVVDGISVCSAANSQDFPVTAPDGAGGTIFAWMDLRNLGGEVYAQRLDNVHGFWGHPEPIVESVADVPNDQGGKVAVNWTASGRDLPNPRSIDFYSVWRAVDALPMGVVGLSQHGLNDLGPDVEGPVYLTTPGHYFERIGTQSAHGWSGYSFAASTRADSIAGPTGDEVFMVAAHYLYDNYVAFASNEVTGHSVDNLAPFAPFLLTAQRVGSNVHLNWNRVRVPDLRDYSVYRATSSGVTPVPTNFLANSDDTLAVDPNAPTTALYYIVTAYDVHANQSDPSNEASVGALTGVGKTPALTALTVLQNHPNPFGATTDFEVGLPSSADVSIEVFDVAGRKVSAMEIRGAKAGWNRIPFAARDARGRPLTSGVYFYRVNAAGATITKKMVVTH